ncbi:MAG: peptidoglycan bridge formation glycyltransferase FemA/FemB family protein [Thermodesulfobacteriota bacterium]
MEYQLAGEIEPQVIQRWEAFIAGQKTGSLFQMPLWQDLYNPKTHRWLFFEGEEKGQIRIVGLIRGRKIPLLGMDCFMERGPVCDDPALLIEGIKAILPLLKKEKAVRLRLNPYWEYPAGERLERDLQELGFVTFQGKFESHFETLTIDLQKPQEEIFKGLRKDSRWRVKQSKKIGVSVKPAQSREELESFYQLLTKMSRKKGMTIPSHFFFLKLWERVLKESGLGILLLSHYEGRLLSGVIITIHGQRAVYSWGASETEHLEKVSKNHLVLWEAILWAKGQGCMLFDMGGYAGTRGVNPELESIDVFKMSFGGNYCRLIRTHFYIFRKNIEKLLEFSSLTRKDLRTKWI